jgi:probable HAF family extracellular repeat protein
MNAVRWRGVTVASAVIAAVAGMAAAGSTSAAASTAVREAPAYRVTDLGTLPGAPDSTAIGINDRGDVVGRSGDHAVLWRNGRIHDLGTLGGGLSTAVDINERGDVVGYGPLAEGGGDRAFIWRGGRLIVLSPLPGFSSSFATAVNDRGQVLGYSTGDSGISAVLWRPDGTAVDLTAETGLSQVTDLDNAGRLVGSVTPDGMNGYPALWYRGRTTVLSDQTGTASAINDRGEVTGYFYSGIGNSFVWRGGRLTEIPRLPDMPEATMMQAQGINNRGQVVGFGGFDGFVWDSGAGTLSTLPGLTRFGPAAYDINDRGRIVGSAGTSPENLEPHAVLLTPHHH